MCVCVCPKVVEESNSYEVTPVETPEESPDQGGLSARAIYDYQAGGWSQAACSVHGGVVVVVVSWVIPE